MAQLLGAETQLRYAPILVLPIGPIVPIVWLRVQEALTPPSVNAAPLI